MDGRLYWAFLDPKTSAERHKDNRGVYRFVKDGWRSEDIKGEPLMVARLAGFLTQLAYYRGTSCGVGPKKQYIADYAIVRGRQVPICEHLGRAGPVARTTTPSGSPSYFNSLRTAVGLLPEIPRLHPDLVEVTIRIFDVAWLWPFSEAAWIGAWAAVMEFIATTMRQSCESPNQYIPIQAQLRLRRDHSMCSPKPARQQNSRTRRHSILAL